jgi:hypothetical protein
MATINRPTFPDPALEVGIAQYPTPNVPDYHTRDGHIILVEKVSIEKGNYNPQPLDGSVKYAKRDANDWPDDLYLVFQQTEPTGKFVFNYWANDRTLASQDPWNYGLTYSLNHPDYKIVTRTYITPREDYAPVALNAVDPVFGGNAIISQQQMVELPDDNPLRSRYVQVQRVYETIPSSVITGKRLTERGDIETLDTQIVVAGTEPDADGLLVTQTSIEAIDAVKSKRTVGSVEEYSTLTTKAKKAGLLGEVDVSDDIVDPATEPDDLTTSIIDSTVEAISATKSRKRTTTSSGPNELTAQKISERGDTQTITKTIVAASTGVTDDSLTLVSSQVDEIDLAKSQKTDVTVESYSQLTTKANKSGLLGNTETTDDIVEPSTDPDELSTTIIESSVEAISKTKSRKRTTTSTGPDLLEGVENKGGLLGETTTTESIVPYGDPADSLSISVIQSSVTPIDEFKSKKITVESTSPTSLTAKKISERGDVQTITKSIVAAATGTTTDSLTLVSSQVDEIDLAKSQKTDVTVESYFTLTTKSNKAGLLGSTSTTDDIVAPATNPDELSLSIIDSSVEAISATKSRKRTTTANGPDTLSGKSERSGLLGSTTTIETIVAAGSSADALTLTRIQSEITPIDSAKSKKTTIDSTGPTRLDGKTIGEFGLVSLEQSIVAYGSALPTPTENTIDLKKEPIDLAKAKLIESSYDSPEELNGYQYDADLNLIISNTKEIISEGAAPLSPTNGLLAYTDTPINAWQSIRIQSKITSLPTARTEYKTGAYSSPNLITGFDVSPSPQMPNWDINVNVTPVMRAKRSYQTVFKSVTSYVYGNPDPTPSSYAIYDPVSINVYYDGYFFKINIPDALTDGGLSVSFTTASNDPVHGYINETFTVPSSTESASTYIGKVGTYQLIAYEIDYWKANIWRVSEQWVLLK